MRGLVRDMARTGALLLLFAAAARTPSWAAAPTPPYVEAVEFSYYLYPRALWERELVWLKNIGIHTVEFSIPWNFHQIQPGEFDFTGRTSPRRDLITFIRLLRKLDLRAWVRPLQPIPGFINNGLPPQPIEAAAESAWLKQIEQTLGTQTASHGGPIAWAEGSRGSLDAPEPPVPVTVLSTSHPSALARSREALAKARGSLLWTDVEDALYPAGWAANPSSLLRKGAVGLSGDEHPATGALRRDAALLRAWTGLFPELHSPSMPKPAAGKLPEGVTAVELVSAAASAVSITNSGAKPFHDELRVFEPLSKRALLIPSLYVAPGESLWLPVSVSLGSDGLCRDCTNFAPTEHIVYATAELLSVEFENGILAMEFAAPEAGEVILQLARKPVGPFLAAGRPTDFDWDTQTLRARLKIPAGKAPDHHVRIGIAIEAPETSAFFNEAKRLVIGRKNTVSTMYSSEEVAKRSRLRVPEGFTANPDVKSPNEINYDVSVPAEALHGDYANLALEADGMRLGRARLQLFRPASIRLMQGMQLHFGPATELTPEPPTVPIEPKAGTNLEISVRNNFPGIQTFRLEASGEGLEFFPPKTEISVAAADERRVELRVFAPEAAPGVREFRLRVAQPGTPGNGNELDLPIRVLLLPRGRTVAWAADLDGDGYPEWIVESQKVRAIFSAQDGGRWMELTWKDTNVNFLPEGGAFAASGPVEVHINGEKLEFSGKNWKRTVSLTDTALTIDQSSTLPADGLAPDKRGNTSLTIAHPSPARAIYTLN